MIDIARLLDGVLQFLSGGGKLLFEFPPLPFVMIVRMRHDSPVRLAVQLYRGFVGLVCGMAHARLARMLRKLAQIRPLPRIDGLGDRFPATRKLSSR